MHSVDAYPTWQRVSAVAPPRSGIIANLRALTLTVWFASLVVNYWWRQQWDWSLEFYEQGVNIRNHYLIGFAIALAGHLTLGPQAWFGAPFRVLSSPSGKLFTLFCLFVFVVSPFSASMGTSGLYAVATWLMFVLCNLYWTSDYFVVRRVLALCGMLLIGWLFALLLHHGLPGGFGGGIGGINRNTTSSLGLAGMICCALSANRTIRWGGIACCALFAVMVTSRGAMVAMAVFVAINYTIYKGTLRAVWHAGLAVFFMTSVLLASTFLQQFVLEDVMRLHDKARGLGTGFTGRVESWKQGIEVFWQSPLIGHGFRAQLGGQAGLGAHGGYVTMLIETGVIGSLLALAAVAIEALRRLKRAMRLRNASTGHWPGVDLEESLRVNTVACAVMFTMLTLWIYEPVYLNMGTVMSVIFFLMFSAPELIAHRRTSLAA